MQGMGEQFLYMRKGQGRQTDPACSSGCSADFFGHDGKRRIRRDLFPAASANKQEITQIVAGHQILEQTQRSGICPLQIVQEDAERVLLFGKQVYESTNDGIEAVLRLIRRHRSHGRLRADDQLNFRDQLDNDLGICT